MNIKSIFFSAFLITILSLPLYAADQNRSDEITGSPFASFAAITPSVVTEPTHGAKFKILMDELRSDLSNEAKMKEISSLLLDQFEIVVETDFESFLSLASVIAFLNGTALDEHYKNILLGIVYLKGWGNIPKDEIYAVKLLEKSKDQCPAGRANFWLGHAHQEAAHILRLTYEPNRNDFHFLSCWFQSNQQGYTPARYALQEWGQSPLLHTFNPVLAQSGSTPATPQQLGPTQIMPPLPAVFFLNNLGGHPQALTLEDPTSCRDGLQLATYVARKQAMNCYVPSAVAAMIQEHDGKTANVGLPIGPLTLTGYYCPDALQNVLSYVLIIKRQEQLKLCNDGNIHLIVNLTTLCTDTRANEYYVPLENPVSLETAIQFFEKINGLKTNFKGWCKALAPEVIDQFFTTIIKEPSIIDNAHLIARLIRISQKLQSKDTKLRSEVVEKLVKSEPFPHALISAEQFLFKGRILSDRENFILLILGGLAEARKKTAVLLAHRSDHKKTPFEELYYWKISHRLLSAASADVQLGFPKDINGIMRPYHTILTLLGSSRTPGWFGPDTHIECTYQTLVKQPGLVVKFLKNEPEAGIQAAIKQYAQENSLQDAPLNDQIDAFVMTKDKASVRKEVIPHILKHSLIRVLTEVPAKM